MMQQKVLASVEKAIEAVSFLQKEESMLFIEQAAKKIADCFLQGNKILIAGNGGSLCDAMHFAEELTGYFRKKRKALPAIALCEPGHLTCVSNDSGYEYVFSRGVEAFGQKGDIFIGLTTSGNSPNLVNAALAARQKGMQVISFLGKGGGKMKGLGDLELIVEGFSTSDRIQEAHMSAIHILIEIMEYYLFPAETNQEKVSLKAAITK